MSLTLGANGGKVAWSRLLDVVSSTSAKADYARDDIGPRLAGA
jgi:hypothetical protein